MVYESAKAEQPYWDLRHPLALLKKKVAGIVADPHILDVALTRARRGLIVLGHEATCLGRELTGAFWHVFFSFLGGVA